MANSAQIVSIIKPKSDCSGKEDHQTRGEQLLIARHCVGGSTMRTHSKNIHQNNGRRKFTLSLIIYFVVVNIVAQVTIRIFGNITALMIFIAIFSPLYWRKQNENTREERSPK